jgi:hypothetical protein
VLLSVFVVNTHFGMMGNLELRMVGREEVDSGVERGGGVDDHATDWEGLDDIPPLAAGKKGEMN